MKSNILSYFETIRRGFHCTNKCAVTAPKTPELLENIRCHKTDEYPVISAEDESPVPPLACNFSKVGNSSHILSLVDESGRVVLYDTNKAGDESFITDWSAHNNAVFDVKWMGKENKLLTASGDQMVCLWDANTKGKLLTFKGHTSSVRSVGFRPFDDAVFSSGSRDGHIRLWDVRCNIKDDKVSSVHVIRNAHTVNQANAPKKKKARLGQPIQDSQQSVTCVLFQDDNLLATGGAVDGCVKVWDIRKIKAENSVAVYSFPYCGPSRRTHGYSSLVFDSYYSRLFANCTDDVIYCYDFCSYSQQPVKTFRGHRNTSFYVKAVLSPDDQYLLSGSSDEHACIWQVDKPSASPVILKGHRSEISDVAWCHTDLFRIVTTSDDYTMRVWRYDPTAKIRKEKGHTDHMYNITGTAECTHRDIGTGISAPATPTVSPRNTLKRAASAPAEGPLQLTPKRPKLTMASTPSPSIKTWLKRSASDSQGAASSDIVCKKPRLTDCPTAQRTSFKRSASEMESDENTLLTETINNGKRRKVTDTDIITESKRNDINTAVAGCVNETKRIELKNVSTSCESVRTGIKSECAGYSSESEKTGHKPACKRALIQAKSNVKDSAVPKDRKQSPDKENQYETSASNKVTLNDSSPNKNKRVLKDTDTNSSPEKRKDVSQEFYSPIRTRLLEGKSQQNVQSPTANLPNLVADGPLYSPKQAISDKTEGKKKVDWLTEMRIQKLSGNDSRDSIQKNKHCSRRLLDKLNSTDKTIKEEEKVEKAGLEAELTMKPKPVSPVRGTKSITSFFKRL